jgi:predicted Zn-dependent protease
LAVAHHDGVMLDDDAMHAMTLHEVGHLIGLDHTKDPLSVMAPRVRVRELSRADRATAQLLYALPPGPMNK